MGSFGFEELLVVAIVAIIVWGENLPQIIRKAARYYAQLRAYLTQVRDEVIKHVPDEKEILPDLRDALPPSSMPVYMDPSDPDYKKPPEEPPKPEEPTKTEEPPKT
jgi:Sec-independent protein translocase protein TatA